MGGTNPSAVKDAGTFEVSTYGVSNGVNYAIDDSEFSNVYTPTPSPLNALVSSVSSYVTGISPSTYTI